MFRFLVHLCSKKNLRRWIDFDNDYKTMDRSFMERRAPKKTMMRVGCGRSGVQCVFGIVHFCSVTPSFSSIVPFEDFQGFESEIMPPVAGGSSSSSMTRAWSTGDSFGLSFT